MNFFIKTLGCKVNNCDSEEMSSKFVTKGWSPVHYPEVADIIILNSCAVTSESVRKTRQIIRKLKKSSQNSIIVLTGCASQFSEFKNIKEINFIVDNSEKVNIFEKILLLLKNKQIREYAANNNFQKLKKERTRAFLKIEDGCNNFCTYCMIPYVRGKIKSKSLTEIQKDVEKLHLKNYKEIVLVGINLCAYGFDLKINLLEAIKIVEQKFNRIRLGSLDPGFFVKNDKILNKILENKNICPNFHLSLQSGSDKILKKMNRKYTSENYIQIIKKIKQSLPIATVTTDLIVGFPGETDIDFKDSLSVIEEAGFLKVNVFPYSKRPGTFAADFDCQINKQTKILRVNQALKFSEIQSNKELKKFVGKDFNVLFEKCDLNKTYSGYTENYIKIYQQSDKNLCGEICKIKFF